MSRPNDLIEKPRSVAALNVRTSCIANAAELIAGAQAMLEQSPTLPNISFHLSLLALEELGKADFYVAAQLNVNDKSDAWIQKKLEDHVFKINWALFSPYFDRTELDPKEFDRISKFAKDAHERRINSLYVDVIKGAELPSAGSTEISLAEARETLELAIGGLEHFSSKPSPDLDAQDELQRWFVETVNDPEGKKVLFSKTFVEKLRKCDGDFRGWAQWARLEFDRIKAESRKVLENELQRLHPEDSEPQPKWQIAIRIFCASHSVRAKELNLWNELIATPQLKFSKPDEFIMEFTFDERTNIAELPHRSLAWSKVFVACLNVGTTGYFWYSLPDSEDQIIDSVVDLTRPDLKIALDSKDRIKNMWSEESSPKKRLVLEQFGLDLAAKCVIAYATLPDPEAEPIFAPYLYGLMMIGKNDIHLNTCSVAMAAFVDSMRSALAHFGEWNREPEEFLSSLDTAFEEIVPDKAERGIILKAFDQEIDATKVTLQKTIDVKRCVDLYLVKKASDHFINLQKQPN